MEKPTMRQLVIGSVWMHNFPGFCRPSEAEKKLVVAEQHNEVKLSAFK
jgi:hypothetical protein